MGYKAVGGGVGVGLQGQAKHIQFKYANVITGSGNKKHGSNEGEQRTTQDLIELNVCYCRPDQQSLISFRGYRRHG